jgi:hypothetical protein
MRAPPATRRETSAPPPVETRSSVSTPSASRIRDPPSRPSGFLSPRSAHELATFRASIPSEIGDRLRPPFLPCRSARPLDAHRLRRLDPPEERDHGRAASLPSWRSPLGGAPSHRRGARLPGASSPALSAPDRSRGAWRPRVSASGGSVSRARPEGLRHGTGPYGVLSPRRDNPAWRLRTKAPSSTPRALPEEGSASRRAQLAFR